MIQGKENTDYAYAVGRIRVMETRLLTRGLVERMLESVDVEELLRILADTAYGSLLAESKEYQELLRVEETSLLRFFDELCLDPILSELVHYRYDFHNLKVLIKAYVAKEDFSHALSMHGNLDIPTLRGVFEEEKFGALPADLERVIARVVEEYYSKNDPRVIDLMVDNEMFQFYGREATRRRSEFLSRLLALTIDLTNIKTLARAKRLKEEKETLRLAILEGGELSAKWYIDLSDEAWESFPQRFYATPYHRIVNEGYESVQEAKSFLKLEKLCDDHLVDFLRVTRFTAFGVEPLVAYFVAKLNELKILRLLFVGKLRGIEATRMKERLPDVF